jgi:hypothetical protein
MEVQKFLALSVGYLLNLNTLLNVGKTVFHKYEILLNKERLNMDFTVKRKQNHQE